MHTVMQFNGRSVPSEQSIQPPYFPHRHHKNGTVDSICLKCYQTVASSKSESDLLEAERVHRCGWGSLHAHR